MQKKIKLRKRFFKQQKNSTNEVVLLGYNVIG